MTVLAVIRVYLMRSLQTLFGLFRLWEVRNVVLRYVSPYHRSLDFVLFGNLDTLP